MRVTLERYESYGDEVVTDTVTIDDAKWTNDLARFLRDWCGIGKRRNDAHAGSGAE